MNLGARSRRLYFPLAVALVGVLSLSGCGATYGPKDQNELERAWGAVGGDPMGVGTGSAAALANNYEGTTFSDDACSPLLGLYANVFLTPSNIEENSPLAHGNLTSPTRSAELGTETHDLGFPREDYFGAGMRLFESSAMAAAYIQDMLDVIDRCAMNSSVFQDPTSPGSRSINGEGAVGYAVTGNGFVWWREGVTKIGQETSPYSRGGTVLVAENLIFGYTYQLEEGGPPVWAEVDAQLFQELISNL